jgi:hypothetical protein
MCTSVHQNATWIGAVLPQGIHTSTEFAVPMSWSALALRGRSQRPCPRGIQGTAGQIRLRREALLQMEMTVEQPIMNYSPMG